MATYEELHGLMSGSSALRNRVVVAVVVAAEEIRGEDGGTANHANRLIWAAGAFARPTAIADELLMAVLAANKDLAVSAIESATDAAIQSAVDAVVDLFATGA